MVHYKRGYFETPVYLPPDFDVKKVLILVDDYDYGEDLMSKGDKLTAVARMIMELRRSLSFFQKRVELCGFYVTINTHRTPIGAEERRELEHDFQIIDMAAVDDGSFATFFDDCAEKRSLVVNEDARQVFLNAADGQFGNLATFISRVPDGSVVDTNVAQGFVAQQTRVWDAFRNELSGEQRQAYDALRCLRSSGLSTRLCYVSRMLRSAGESISDKAIGLAVEGIWHIRDGVIVTYDGQFPGQPDAEPAPTTVIDVVLAIGRRLSRTDPAQFQDELKRMLSVALQQEPTDRLLQLLRRCRRWYPHDRYFGYLHAVALHRRKKTMRAIAVLFKYLRKPPDDIHKCAWVDAHLHLLLGRIYMSMGLHKGCSPEEAHAKVEREFYLASLLASMDDREGPGIAVKPRGHSQRRQKKTPSMQELGAKAPAALTIDRARFRASVLYEYAMYLSKEKHRELDAVACIEGAVDSVPGFAEAHLAAADLLLMRGDSHGAREHIEAAERGQRRLWDAATYQYMVEREKWRADLDDGDVASARQHFERAREIAQRDPLQGDEALQANLSHLAADNDAWASHERVALVRKKVFGDSLHYELEPYHLAIDLPKEWKIDREAADTNAPPSCAVLFSSPVLWDETGRTETDASISIVAGPQNEDNPVTGRSQAEAMVKGADEDKRMKQTSHLMVDDEALPRGRLSIWLFEWHAGWPKKGMIVSLDTEKFHVVLHLMCQKTGIALFWSVFEQVLKQILGQDVFTGSEQDDLGSSVVRKVRDQDVRHVLLRHMNAATGAFAIGDDLIEDLMRRHLDREDDTSASVHLAQVLALQIVHQSQRFGLQGVLRDNIAYVRRLVDDSMQRGEDGEEVYDVLGILADVEGKHEVAREYFRQMGERASHPFWRIRLATSYAQTKEFAEAIAEVDRAIAEGHHSIAYKYKADYLDAIGEYEEALKSLQKVDSEGVRAPSILPALQKAYFRLMNVGGVLKTGWRIIVRCIRHRDPGRWLYMVKASMCSSLAILARCSKATWMVSRHIPGARSLHMLILPPYQPEMTFAAELFENKAYAGCARILKGLYRRWPEDRLVLRNSFAASIAVGDTALALEIGDKIVTKDPADIHVLDIVRQLRHGS